MTLQGPTYPKTTFSYQERPVASAKLNTWDDRIEAALALLCALLHHLFGNRDGVLRDADSDHLRVIAQSTPDLTVTVQPGLAFISASPYHLAAVTATPPVTAPATYPRIDLVQANLATWTISVREGVESATPVAPVPDAHCLALAELHLRPGMTSIKDTDDTTNGYIVDSREFL